MMVKSRAMRCEECRKKRATVHVTILADTGPVQRHLCDECYEQEANTPTLSASDIFAQLIGALAPELQKSQNATCPECGMNYLEFRQNLLLGCPKDYEVFDEPLEEFLYDVHGATRHVGRIPMGEAQRMSKESRLEVLNRKLEEAVENENYEDAVDIRDEIARLEHDIAENT